MERRRLLKAAIILALAETSACSNLDPIHVEPSPTISPPKEVTPTPTPFMSQIIETATNIPEIDLFRLGDFNPGVTPFGLEITPPLMKELGYMFPKSTLKFRVDKPIKVETTYFNEDVAELFKNTALDNSEGNPGAAFLTDRENIILELVHSMEPGAPGDLAKIIGSFILKNPEKKDQILGLAVTIKPEGQKPITSTIADVITVPEKDFQDQVSNESFWLTYPEGDTTMTFLTEAAGIPDDIRNDDTNGVYYLIIASCTPENGDEWSDPLNLRYTDEELSNHNTKNRTMVVLRFTSRPTGDR